MRTNGSITTDDLLSIGVPAEIFTRSFPDLIIAAFASAQHGYTMWDMEINHHVQRMQEIQGYYQMMAWMVGTNEAKRNAMSQVPTVRDPFQIRMGTRDVPNSLTRAQRRNVETLNNVIDNNLQAGDFSGTLRDLQGNPVPKPGGGFWDHRQEMV